MPSTRSQHPAQLRTPARRGDEGHSMQRTTLLAAGAVSGLALLSGCGSTPISKADYVSKANAVCTDAGNKIKALGRPTDKSKISGYFDGIVNAEQGTIDGIKKLGYPKGDKDQITSKFLQPAQRQIDAFNGSRANIEQDVQTGNRADAQKLLAQVDKSSGASSQSINGFLRSYGLTTCASLGSS